MDKKLLSYTFLSGLVGVVIGALAVNMVRTGAIPPEKLHVLEQERIKQIIKERESTDLAAMQGPCNGDIVKALPSGIIAGCFDGKWGIPTQFGLKGPNGVIYQRPPFCGPGAHVVTDKQHGQLCVQNEGSWKTAAREERVPCLPLPGTAPGLLDMCSYSSDGKVIGRSAQTSSIR